METRYCWMCGETYDIPPGEDEQPEVISKPGATIYAESCPIPYKIQAQVSHNLTCPGRPGGIDFRTWFKWRVRKWLGLKR